MSRFRKVFNEMLERNFDYYFFVITFLKQLFYKKSL